MKELEWSQGFPNYNPMGVICCYVNQSSDPIRPKTLCSQSPTPIISRWNLITIGQLVLEIFMFESVDGRTDARMHGRRLESHTLSSPWAFGSGELLRS